MRVDHQETAGLDGGCGKREHASARALQLFRRLGLAIANLRCRPLVTRQVAVCDLEPRLLHDIGMEPDRVRRLCHLQESAAWRR